MESNEKKWEHWHQMDEHHFFMALNVFCPRGSLLSVWAPGSILTIPSEALNIYKTSFWKRELRCL